MSAEQPPQVPAAPGFGEPQTARDHGGACVGWGGRVLAYLIDCIAPAILLAAGAIAARPHPETVQRGDGITVTQVTGFGLLFYLGWALGLIFFLWNKGYREGTTGKSIGKQVLDQTTIREATGKPLGTGRAVLRWLLLGVDFAICYIGVLWPLWDKQHRCLLSDRLTGAVVLQD